MSENGSITGIYSVLVDGDDHNEPIADAVRGILTGISLPGLAARNHYQAIDVLQSVKRLMTDSGAGSSDFGGRIRERHLPGCQGFIDIGAYVSSNAKIDEALKYIDKINEFLCQKIDEKFEYEEMVQMMINFYQEVE